MNENFPQTKEKKIQHFKLHQTITPTREQLRIAENLGYSLDELKRAIFTQPKKGKWFVFFLEINPRLHYLEICHK